MYKIQQPSNDRIDDLLTLTFSKMERHTALSMVVELTMNMIQRTKKDLDLGNQRARTDHECPKSDLELIIYELFINKIFILNNPFTSIYMKNISTA